MFQLLIHPSHHHHKVVLASSVAGVEATQRMLRRPPASPCTSNVTCVAVGGLGRQPLHGVSHMPAACHHPQAALGGWQLEALRVALGATHPLLQPALALLMHTRICRVVIEATPPPMPQQTEDFPSI